ncbi:MerR family transcriptional regulator [Mycobacterium sp.]|uniref:MerR family transcriptional regulator n=1 Tax=Mycobacterium sp. TaxID=1785 RepID=UPI00333FC1F2|nr:MerR family transcriptional regulator [Mycobacterium sp.]
MGARVSIGDFSVMTHLSKKALRHYHDLGLLEPAHIDAHSGYRFYDTGQVDHAHIIRRFRYLGMAIPDLKALLSTDDVGERNEIITAHLRHMEEQLQHTKDTVRELGELLSRARRHTKVELRFEPQTAVWAITSTVDIDDIGTWFVTASDQLSDVLRRSVARPSGPAGGLYERELFTDSRGEASVFIPTDDPIPPPAPVRTRVLPAAEVAILTHQGASHTGVDRSYAELGTYVTEHLISGQGPIRERYLGAEPGHFARFDRTEICWPIFSTCPVTTTPLVEDPPRQ